MRGRALVLVAAAVVIGAASAAARQDARAKLGFEVATCKAGTVRVVFDPARSVVVTRAGRRVAFASFDGHSADGACGAAVRQTTLAVTDDSLLGPGIYRRAAFACTTSKPLRVAVHAISDGDHPGRTLGSSLTLSVGRATILGAVLKNKGDPNASRVYRAARFCRR